MSEIEETGPVRPAGSVPANEVAAGEGTSMQVLVGPGEAPNFCLRRFVMEPGGGMPLHTNEVEHEQYVLRGSARMRIGHEVHRVSAGDAVYVPAGVEHDYRADADEPFEFICVVPNREDRIRITEE
ncbi:MAG: cupin domain-containing protein [Gemmatimonadetes bacterium]|nr:cupin domain-containing protein [Gemmatimonadota bacterium]